MLDYTSYICALSTLFTIMARVGHEQVGSQNLNSVRIRSERKERILARVAISGDRSSWFLVAVPTF